MLSIKDIENWVLDTKKYLDFSEDGSRVGLACPRDVALVFINKGLHHYDQVIFSYEHTMLFMNVVTKAKEKVGKVLTEMLTSDTLVSVSKVPCELGTCIRSPLVALATRYRAPGCPTIVGEIFMRRTEEPAISELLEKWIGKVDVAMAVVLDKSGDLRIIIKCKQGEPTWWHNEKCVLIPRDNRTQTMFNTGLFEKKVAECLES